MSDYTVTTSAELMENYLQADILEPQKAFAAVQTDAGASLLFSIGTDGAFSLTQETPGVTHGWVRTDLSSARAKADFPGGATCRTFAVAQPGNVHLAMVLSDGTNDHLYLSLANSAADTSWASAPSWTACPFDAQDATGASIAPPSPFQIAGVFISEATDAEYIVVDVVRNPTEADALIARYYMDGGTPGQPRWVPHDVAADIEAARYASCLGRSTGAFGVDGIYTAGTIDGQAQLVYTPLYNAFDPTVPPTTARLQLPGNAVADTIAACRNADMTSDLYATSGGALYRFASAQQEDGGTAVQIATSPLLSGARALYAYAAAGHVTVWGLSGSDAVFYLTAPAAQLATASAWSLPLAILTGVDAISPYVDRAYGANTFFAHGPQGLVKAVKDPATTIWSRRSITLPPADALADATPISSYTTRIHVAGTNGQAAANVTVSLTSPGVTSVYINHLYYILGPEAIEVQTDALGAITIVQATHTMAAARIAAVVDSQPYAINPMDAPLQRNAQLGSSDALKAAVITNDDGTTRPLVPAGTSDTDLQAVAQSNQGLHTAYANVGAPAAPRPAPNAVPRPTPSVGTLALANVGESIEADFGDLVSWLESGVEAVIQVIEDAAAQVWRFVATIAGQIYHAVLDVVEKIAAAMVWVYDQIKIAIEDVIRFFQFLFGWQDILTTHRVFKNVFTQLVRQLVSGLGTAKADADAAFAQARAAIDGWAGLSGFDQTPGGTASANPPLAGQHGAPANLGAYHYQGNAAAAQSTFAPAAAADSVYQDLVNAANTEKTVLSNAVSTIQTQIVAQFDTLSLDELVKRILAVLADAVLASAQNLVDTVLDLLAQLAEGMLDALTATIDIPVLSWLYRKMTGDDLSMLDVVCLIAAIPATILYKLVAGAAPFPSGDPFTVGLLGATSFDAVAAQFVQSAPPQPLNVAANVASPRMAVALAAAPLAAAPPVLDQTRLKTFGLVSGIFALGGSVVLVLTSTAQKVNEVPTAMKKPIAALAGAANIAYVSPNIATLVNAASDNWYQQFNNVLTGISVLKGLAAVPLAEAAGDVVELGFPMVEAAINVAWNLPVAKNLIDNQGAWNTTYRSLIPESIGNFAFNLGGILELGIAVEVPPVKEAMIAVQDVLMVVYGGFMVIAGSLYQGLPGQSH